MNRFKDVRIVGLIALAALFGGCSPVVATRGNLIDDARMQQVAVGRSTVNDVAAVFGSPSTVSTFDPKVWYYFGQREEKTAFFDPEIVERRVVLVEFSEFGVVRRIEELGLEDAQSVELVERETPTLGRRLTVLEQLIGNFGRFNNGGQAAR